MDLRTELKDRKENMSLSEFLNSQPGFDKSTLAACLEVDKKREAQKKFDRLPDIVIDGNTVGFPGYHFVKLPIDDPHIYLLGNLTKCCLYMGSDGQDCIIDGATRVNNGFYVLLQDRRLLSSRDDTRDELKTTSERRKPKKIIFNKNPLIQGKINYQDFEIVGTGYTWISEDNNIVIDSWENRYPAYKLIDGRITDLRDDKVIIPFLELFAKKVTESKGSSCLRVTIGIGGKTPDQLRSDENREISTPDTILEGIQYTDSASQVLLACNEKECDRLTNIILKKLAEITNPSIAKSLFSKANIYSYSQAEAILKLLNNSIVQDYIKKNSGRWKDFTGAISLAKKNSTYIWDILTLLDKHNLCTYANMGDIISISNNFTFELQNQLSRLKTILSTLSKAKLLTLHTLRYIKSLFGAKEEKSADVNTSIDFQNEHDINQFVTALPKLYQADMLNEKILTLLFERPELADTIASTLIKLSAHKIHLQDIELKFMIDHPHYITPITGALIRIQENQLSISEFMNEIQHHPEKADDIADSKIVSDIKSDDIHFQKVFYEVIKKGNIELIKQLLARKQASQFINSKFNELTPLQLAASLGKNDVVNLLLIAGANVDLENDSGHTALSEALVSGHVDTAQILVDAKANMHTKLHGGENLPTLHVAISANQAKSVKFLLEKKEIDIEVKTNKGRTPLMFACGRDDIKSDILTQLLAQQADVNAVDNEKITPLIAAAAAGHDEAAQLLLKAHADFNLRDQQGHTALWWSIHKGKENIVNMLLKKMSFLNSADFNLILLACENSTPQTLQALIKKNADINFTDEQGKTPLMIAASLGKSEIIDLLLEMKADVNKQDQEGKSALWWALHQGGEDAINLILKKINSLAPLESKDTSSDNPKISTPLHLASKIGNLNVIKKLIILNSELDRIDPDDKTPLIYACSNGSSEVVNSLLEAKSDLNKKDSKGRTGLWWALHKGHFELANSLINRSNINILIEPSGLPTLLNLASASGNSDTVKLLLEKKADLHGKDKEGRTSLILASENGHFATSELLIKANAAINLKDKSGRTALWWACKQNHFDIANLLLEYKADVNKGAAKKPSPFHLACEYGNLEMMNALLIREAKEYVKDHEEKKPFERIPHPTTLLRQASEKGYLTSVKFLIKNHVSVEAESKTTSPLLLAVMNHHTDIVKVLLEAKANPNIVDNVASQTVLGMAAGNGYNDIVNLLLQYGANVDLPNRFGLSPLYLATSFEQKDIVKLLLSKGASINASTKSPLQKAIDKNNHDICALLQFHSNKITSDVLDWLKNQIEKIKEHEKIYSVPANALHQTTHQFLEEKIPDETKFFKIVDELQKQLLKMQMSTESGLFFSKENQFASAIYEILAKINQNVARIPLELAAHVQPMLDNYFDPFPQSGPELKSV